MFRMLFIYLFLIYLKLMINSHGSHSCCLFRGASTTEPLRRCWEDRGCNRKAEREGEIEKYQRTKDAKGKEERRGM